jgi:hypothetical protein
MLVGVFLVLSQSLQVDVQYFALSNTLATSLMFGTGSFDDYKYLRLYQGLGNSTFVERPTPNDLLKALFDKTMFGFSFCSKTSTQPDHVSEQSLTTSQHRRISIHRKRKEGAVCEGCYAVCRSQPPTDLAHFPYELSIKL